MSLYAKYILPRLINLAMQNKVAMAERRKFVPLASGTVLEVGVGSGINIPLYGRDVETLLAVGEGTAPGLLCQRRPPWGLAIPIRFRRSASCSSDRRSLV